MDPHTWPLLYLHLRRYNRTPSSKESKEIPQIPTGTFALLFLLATED
jgi:hypothetical protein